MGLKIYSAADPDTDYSLAGAFTNPFLIVADGKYGTVSQYKLYLRNDDSFTFYVDNEISVVDTTDADYVDGSLDISWKLSAGNTQPTDEEWDDITTANTISMSNLGALGVANTSTYLPFWIRVETPRNLEVQTVLHVQLKISTSAQSV